jgi:hypothetical protein
LLTSTTIPILTKGLLLLMNWNARKLAITAIVVLSLTTATSTSLLVVMLWKQSHSVAAVSEPAPSGDPELALNGPGDLNLRPGKDGTMRVRTEDGDFIVTNGVNHIVTTDEQGRRKEITIVTDENGGSDRRVSVRSFRGGPARVRGGAGAGSGTGAGGGAEGGAPGGEVRVEEDVLAPPTPAKP